MIAKITKAVVEKLPLGSMVWDTQLVGFGVRRQLRHPHYVLRYRLNGKQHLHSIGRHGAYTPDTARREATRLLGQIVSGKSIGSKSVDCASGSFGQLLTQYLERKRSSLKPKSIVEITRHLQVQSRSLHGLRLSEIDRRTIAQLLAEIEERSGPVARNRVRTSLSAMFGWSIREGLIDGVNPVAGTGKASEGPSRDRVLSECELRSILKALDASPFSEIIRLLVLTGQRRNEIGGLTWSEIDLGRGLICLPAARVKNNRNHEIPISRQVREILLRQPRVNEWVFGKKWNGWSEDKARLDRRLNGSVAHWTLHDCRRSCATLMAERLGVLPHVLECVLNHVGGFRGGVQGIYNRAKYSTEMRDALDRLGEYVDGLTA
jgi:integrase